MPSHMDGHRASQSPLEEQAQQRSMIIGKIDGCSQEVTDRNKNSTPNHGPHARIKQIFAGAHSAYPCQVTGKMAETWNVVADAYGPGAVALEPSLCFLQPFCRKLDPFAVFPEQRLAEFPPECVTAQHAGHGPEEADRKG